MHARSGVVLFAALGILSLLGLLMAGVFTASLRARYSTRVTAGEIALAAAADHAVYGALDDRGFTPLADLPLGVATVRDDVPTPEISNVSTRVAITRLPGNLLWIVADAAARDSAGIERRVALIAEFPVAGVPPGAAIVARGPVARGDAVHVLPDTAHDADCAQPTAPDVRVASDSSTYLLTARQLGMLRDKPGVLVVDGDTTIAGGNLEGILIVLGTLTVSGSLNVSGLVVARGAVRATAGDLSVDGALLAFNAGQAVADTADAVSLGSATLRYSPCIIARALRRAAPPGPLRHRGWSELF